MIIKITHPAQDRFVATNLHTGQCFMRPNSTRERDGLYMRIAVCGAVRRLESIDDRLVPVINLRTGTLFFIYESEHVVPMNNSVVVSDASDVSVIQG